MKFDENGNLVGEDGSIIKTKEELEGFIANGAPDQSQKTFTQEDLDNIITKRLEKAEKSWMKRQEEAKSESEKLQTMTEEQKTIYNLQKQVLEFEKRQKEADKKELKFTAEKILLQKGLDASLANFVDLTDAESAANSITTLETTLSAQLEKMVNEKIAAASVVPGQSKSNADQKTADQREEERIMKQLGLI